MPVLLVFVRRARDSYCIFLAGTFYFLKSGAIVRRPGQIQKANRFITHEKTSFSK
jgi:hypothetical protein